MRGGVGVKESDEGRCGSEGVGREEVKRKGTVRREGGEGTIR